VAARTAEKLAFASEGRLGRNPVMATPRFCGIESGGSLPASDVGP